MRKKQDDLKKAVDWCLEYQFLKKGPGPNLEEIIEMRREVEQCDEENFLNPQIIKELQELNFKASIGMIKEMSTRRIWKPTSFQFSKKSEMTELLKNIR